jgi:hypothetical protein
MRLLSDWGRVFMAWLISVKANTPAALAAMDCRACLREISTACFCNGAVTSWFKVLSSFNVLVSWDRTRLRKGTTAETQTL